MMNCRAWALVRLSFIFIFLTACERKLDDMSSLSIVFPQSLEGQGGVLAASSSAISYEHLCFAADLVGQGIKTEKPSSCDVALGYFAGSVAPGKSLSLTGVPYGADRRVTVYGILRNSLSEPCPSLSKGFGALDRSQVFKLGVSSAFETHSPQQEIIVTITLPATHQHLATEASLPATCVSQSNPSTKSLRHIYAAREVVQGGNFVIHGTVTHSQRTRLTGGPFVMKIGAASYD